jgi:hypothetical protein
MVRFGRPAPGRYTGESTYFDSRGMRYRSPWPRTADGIRRDIERADAAWVIFRDEHPEDHADALAREPAFRDWFLAHFAETDRFDKYIVYRAIRR